MKIIWNDNGHYIEHVLEQDTKVWTGVVAGQRYKTHEGKKFYLQGGENQIFIKSGLLKDKKIKPKLTGRMQYNELNSKENTFRKKIYVN